MFPYDWCLYGHGYDERGKGENEKQSESEWRRKKEKKMVFGSTENEVWNEMKRGRVEGGNGRS